ncbi:hypothetical protein [Rhodococcus koreensis]
MVEQLAERTGVADRWIGDANREDHACPPVRRPPHTETTVSSPDPGITTLSRRQSHDGAVMIADPAGKRIRIPAHHP